MTPGQLPPCLPSASIFVTVLGPLHGLQDCPHMLIAVRPNLTSSAALMVDGDLLLTAAHGYKSQQKLQKLSAPCRFFWMGITSETWSCIGCDPT